MFHGRTFFCGGCAQPTYSQATFPLCPLCHYEAVLRHERRLKEEAARERTRRLAREERDPD